MQTFKVEYQIFVFEREINYFSMFLQDAVDRCMGINDCSCWEEDSIEEAYQAVKVCDDNTNLQGARGAADDRTECLDEFRRCRKAEDDSASIMAACSTGRRSMFYAWRGTAISLRNKLRDAYNNVRRVFYTGTSGGRMKRSTIENITACDQLSKAIYGCKF